MNFSFDRALICSMLLLTAADATAQTVIKLGTIAPEGSIWHDALLEIREQWREISNGEVELRIYAGGVLDGEDEMIRKMQRGARELGRGIAPHRSRRRVPAIAALFRLLRRARVRAQRDLERARTELRGAGLPDFELGRRRLGALLCEIPGAPPRRAAPTASLDGIGVSGKRARQQGARV